MRCRAPKTKICGVGSKYECCHVQEHERKFGEKKNKDGSVEIIDLCDCVCGDLTKKSE